MSDRHRIVRLAVLVLLAATALAAPARAATPEQRCQAGRYKAAAGYAACMQKVQAKFAGSDLDDSDYERHLASSAKCLAKYAAVWVKLQAQAAGTAATCDSPRFVAQGDGTVMDLLTGLQWEQKTDDGSIHDKDDVHSWTAAFAGTAADGTVFTAFLPALNGACFAGHCDWRLPTIAELQTTLREPYPCPSGSCIDPSIFGPHVVNSSWWSSTSWVGNPMVTWSVGLFQSTLDSANVKSSVLNVRAVRSGL